MAVDGLFIIELFRKISGHFKVYDNDPIFHSDLKSTRVVRDLVLLENQIPMSVLQTLFDLTKDPISDHFSLVQLALIFFEGASNTTISAKWTELQRSGVKFKKGSECGSLIDIKFSKGVFKIPPLLVDDCTEFFFRNLIAHEQQHSQGTHYITSYALLMDYLVNSAEDVAFLRDLGIIKNHLGDDNKVSSLFTNLCSEIYSGKFCYGDLCDKVHQYYNQPYNKWKANLKRDYCNSPWTILPVVAAILILFLTIWATLFTTLPVFNVNFKL
ncbi:UPF0481 protein At3g47200-like [Telopea speciosissima]|uniref:UPF0481 protein At3g47200-like n=1 Tax=Telopea speciosissima TaxID=54955 RepID=UPI001CC38336|nr:UPF0481 protein At3g47200-like [Telopea speciosissima]